MFFRDPDGRKGEVPIPRARGAPGAAPAMDTARHPGYTYGPRQ